MKRFELLPEGKGVFAAGSTRAGLYTAALQGWFAAPEQLAGDDDSPKVERLFKLEAGDAVALMKAILSEADRAAKEHGETYEDVSFTLVTDKKAEGAFVGHKGPAPKCSLKDMSPIEKNEDGEWVTTIYCN